MGLMLKRQRNGELRPQWYGVYTENGRRTVVNLAVDIQGKPPASGRVGDPGNADFEKSRKAAAKALEKQSTDAGRRGRADHLIERLIEQKTGKQVEHVRIADVGERWLTMPRGGELTDAHAAGVRSAFATFKRHMHKRNGDAVFLYEVTTADAGAFATLLRKTYAPSTARRYLVLLRSACKRFLPAGVANPFAGIVARRTGGGAGGAAEVHRKPFTPEELQLLLDAAEDDTMRHLITAAACTGMRRGDVCRLRWSDCDLAGGMVTAKSSKTGEPVEVPIFHPLLAVLKARQGNGSEFVFPSAAAMLAKNPDGLTWRFKKVVARAFGAAGPIQKVDLEAIKLAGRAAIEANIPEGDRRKRMLDTLDRYASGQSVRQIEKDSGRPRSGVSVDLRMVERWTGSRFMRALSSDNVKVAITSATRTPREHGQRSASVRDWHALRTTFVTLALSAGVPMELVRRVTGHATVEVVLKHYFRPNREQFRAALTVALPDVLTGGQQPQLTPADKTEFASLAERLAAGTLSPDEKVRLQAIAAQA